MKKVIFTLALLTFLYAWISASPVVTSATDEVETVAWHNTSLTNYLLQRAAHHPIYKKIADGTLDMNKFLGFIQQDDAYVTSLFESIQIIYDLVAESDNYTRDELKNVLENKDSYRSFFKGIYDNSSFVMTTPKQVNPVTIGYMAFQRRAAMYEETGVALMSFFACYTVWHQMGVIIAPIADLKHHPNHKFYSFIEAMSPSDAGNLQLKKYVDLVTYHYDNSLASREKMLETYLQALVWEWKFAESGLTGAAETNNSPILTFTDLVESQIAVNLQQQMVHHVFWKQLAEGTVSIASFEALVQQDLNYLGGFFAAWKKMEEAENDVVKKEKLRKNGTAKIILFKNLVSVYGFELDVAVEPYAQEYINLITTSANRSIYEGLASLYPCYYLWNTVANQPFMKEALKNPNHPYKDFVNAAFDPSGSSLDKMKKLTTGYYESLNHDWVLKDQMFRAAGRGIHKEFLFVDGVMNGPKY